MATLKVYLDGVLLADNPLGLQDMDFTIEREDQLGGTEQILREKTETSLKFVGDGYRKIANSRITNYCTDILCTIVYECGGKTSTMFEGYIQQRNVEIDISRCIATVSPLKDASFSALIRDYMDVEIPLYYTKSLNCETITPINQTYTFSNDPADPTSYVYKRGFDVLDIFKFYVSYITDGRINVVSDYLSATSLGDARYAITTGFNLHSTAGNQANTSPILSFATLFTELRKKLKLYMGIEYDGQNIPYLRIEPESYFYDSGTTILTIDTVPVGTLEKLDSDRLYNSIRVGSQDTQLVDSANLDYPQNALVAWNDEGFSGCGGCAGDKENTLDLVSEMIIDSNMFYEILNIPDGDAYEHDQKIYLFWYYIDVDTSERIAYIANNPPFNKNIYNETLINETVLGNWVGQGTGCVATARSAANAFSVNTGEGLMIGDATLFFYSMVQERAFSGDVIFDNENSISSLNVSLANPYTGTSPCLPSGVDTASAFTCPADGNYNFRAQMTIDKCSEPKGGWSNGDIYYTLSIEGYQDNTVTPLDIIYKFDDIQSPLQGGDFGTTIQPVTLSVETGMISLVSGNVVYAKINIYFSNVTSDLQLCEKSSYFTLIDDDQSCDSITDEAASLPYIVTLDHPICNDEWETMRNNKSGVVLMNGKEYYIKKVQYLIGQKSRLTLLAKDTICEPCEDVVCSTSSCGTVTIESVIYESCRLDVTVNAVSTSECDQITKIQVLLERYYSGGGGIPAGWTEVPLDDDEFTITDGLQTIMIDQVIDNYSGGGGVSPGFVTDYRVSVRVYCPLTFWTDWTSPTDVVFYGSGCTGI